MVCLYGRRGKRHGAILESVYAVGVGDVDHAQGQQPNMRNSPDKTAMKTATAKLPRLTAQDIEISVALHFGHRVNLIVPNVSWGWGLRHEADMIVLRPSGLCDEVEIKTTAADIRADLGKPNSHWENRRIARVWFAVPAGLKDCPDIPAAAGVIAVIRELRQPGDYGWTDRVEVHRPAKLRTRQDRKPVSDADRIKLAELGAMRIWDLKSALAARNRDVQHYRDKLEQHERETKGQRA